LRNWLMKMTNWERDDTGSSYFTKVETPIIVIQILPIEVVLAKICVPGETRSSPSMVSNLDIRYHHNQEYQWLRTEGNVLPSFRRHNGSMAS
jgi:hypothetical protein